MDLQDSSEQLNPEEAPLRRRNPNPNPNPNPSLRPLPSTAFKRESRRQRRERKRQEKQEQLLLLQLERLLPLTEKPRPSKPSDVEWPCNPLPEPVTTGWGQHWRTDPPEPAAAATPPPPVSAEEIARIAATQAQEKALQACQEFLSGRDLSDDEGDDDPIEFFVGLFEKDEELRGFYERNWEKGKFCCLVCEGMGKGGRMFVSAAGLVQHASTIWRMKGIAEHRAFGRAACRVLGWDGRNSPSSNLGVGEQVVESTTDVHYFDDIQEKAHIIDRCDPVRTVTLDVMDCI